MNKNREFESIYYLGFYDVPQTFFVEYGNSVLYFVRDFDDDADDYETEYRVYKIDTIDIETVIATEQETGSIFGVKLDLTGVQTDFYDSGQICSF